MPSEFVEIVLGRTSLYICSIFTSSLEVIVCIYINPIDSITNILMFYIN